MSNEAREFMKQCKYGVVACSRLDDESYTVHHFVGYLKKPTPEIIKMLETELNTDTDFHLVGRIGKDVWLQEASAEQVEHYKKIFE